VVSRFSFRYVCFVFCLLLFRIAHSLGRSAKLTKLKFFQHCYCPNHFESENSQHHLASRNHYHIRHHDELFRSKTSKTKFSYSTPSLSIFCKRINIAFTVCFCVDSAKGDWFSETRISQIFWLFRALLDRTVWNTAWYAGRFRGIRIWHAEAASHGQFAHFECYCGRLCRRTTSLVFRSIFTLVPQIFVDVFGAGFRNCVHVLAIIRSQIFP
jgi:hypothetical protein